MFRRVIVAIVVGVLAGCLCYAHRLNIPLMAHDLTWALRGAEVLLRGGDPYTAVLEPLPFWVDAPLFYPLPALIIAMPFTLLPDIVVVSVFIGISSAFLAFAVTRTDWDGLLIFGYAPYWVALDAGQWSILLTAALLMPSLAWIAVCKPSIGLPILLRRWNKYWLAAGALGFIGSLFIVPNWPVNWLNNSQQHPGIIPLFTLTGIPFLLLLLRWREPTARLIMLLACVPQMPFYDQLMLGTVAHTRWARLVLAITSWLTVFAWMTTGHPPYWWVLGLYGPVSMYVLSPVVVPTMRNMRQRMSHKVHST